MAGWRNRRAALHYHRTAAFKKAAELCDLTGAEIAVMVGSECGNKVLSFGHPSVDAVVGCYLNDMPSPAQCGAAAPPISPREGDSSYMVECEELEKKVTLAKYIAEQEVQAGRFWWDRPIESMGVEEAERFEASLTKLCGNVEAKVRELHLKKND